MWTIAPYTAENHKQWEKMYNSIALQIFYLYSSASADLGPTLMNVKKL